MKDITADQYESLVHLIFKKLLEFYDIKPSRSRHEAESVVNAWMGKNDIIIIG